MRNIAPIVFQLLAALPVTAQVTLDGSLGPTGSVPLLSNEYAITDLLGTYSGPNLFHSFSSFDVGEGHAAVFSASLGTPARVIARVTGGDGTQIDGTLRSTIGGADLFLLDSRGVTFGKGAHLEMNDGSFYTSSANALRFMSGPDFVTADATQGPLLSAAAPAAFGFTSESPAPVVLDRTNRLSVPVGETLSIVGGNVFLIGEQGGSFVIETPGAAVEIASAAGPIDIPVQLADFDIESAPPDSLGTIEFVAATASLSGTTETPAGSVMIRAGEFVLSGGSGIVAQNESNAPAVGPIDIASSGDLRLLHSPTLIQSWTVGAGAAGDVLLTAEETVRIADGAQVQLLGTSPVEGGEAPDAEITGRVVEVVDGGEVEALSISAAPASDIDITASERIRIDNNAVVITEVREGHSGDPGSLSLMAPHVELAGNAQVTTLNSGADVGASVEIGATRLLEVTDGSGILTESIGPASTGGPLHLTAGELTVTDAGSITSISAGGTGGNIQIAADHVLVSNASNRAEGTNISADNGGAIDVVDADLVELRDGGQIITTALADVTAGSLSVAADTVVASGMDAQARPSGLFSRTQSASADGAGGALSIDARVLEVENGATISSATFGAADAGRVDIDASERVTIRGGENGFSLVSAAALPDSEGNGGVVEIRTSLLELRDGGQVTTSTSGTGDAGLLFIDADRVDVSGVAPVSSANQSGFFSRSNLATEGEGGDGGSISITATQSVLLSDRGTVSAESAGSGLAGDVFIDGGQLFQIENASVSTEADSSAGGNVKVTADSLVYLLGSSIETSVSGGGGGGGDVTIDPVHTVLNDSLIATRAVTGEGGDILIQTDHYFQSGDSLLDPSSDLGIDGTIQVTAPDTDLTAGLARLPSSFLDASALLERDCAARTERAGSFAVRVQTLPPAPDAPLTPVDAGYCPLSETKP